ncbi:MAG TPA: hypothetical protein VLF91_02900 [Candidatus Saccharimonadales bacterium]|nr:hypothetical protein [Candidatus Saccharimonadales bacterium]
MDMDPVTASEALARLQPGLVLPGDSVARYFVYFDPRWVSEEIVRAARVAVNQAVKGEVHPILDENGGCYLSVQLLPDRLQELLNIAQPSHTTGLRATAEVIRDDGRRYAGTVVTVSIIGESLDIGDVMAKVKGVLGVQRAMIDDENAFAFSVHSFEASFITRVFEGVAKALNVYPVIGRKGVVPTTDPFRRGQLLDVFDGPAANK